MKSLLQILALIGIVDAIYLINLHYNSGTCVGELSMLGPYTIDCGAVAASDYSEFAGIPIAFFGFLYYLTTFLVINFESNIETLIFEKIGFTGLQFLLVLISVGFIVSLYLLYLQLGVLELICTYCMVSIAVTTFKLITIGTLNFGISP